MREKIQDIERMQTELNHLEEAVLMEKE